jgi:hypothetical protein
MAKTSELYSTLLDGLRSALPSEGASIAAVEAELSDGEPGVTAQEIIRKECENKKLADVSEADLYEALILSVSEVLQAEANPITSTVVSDAAVAVQTAFSNRLKTFAAEADRLWLIVVPVATDFQGDAFNELSTVNARRVLIGPCDSQAQLDARLASVCGTVGVTPAAGATPYITALRQSHFVAQTKGSGESALRNGLRSLNIGRDALRFAEFIHAPRESLGPLRAASATELVIEARLVAEDGRENVPKLLRHADVSFDGVEVLRQPRVRAFYDATARVLEAQPENTQEKQKTFRGRVARSIRIFSRAVVQNNRDMRFLLLLVAFEVMLNRKDAPIAEALAEYGALLTVSGVEERLRLARELKKIYDTRSRFVHDGQIPSELLGEDKFARAETVVFRTWSALMRELLPFSDRGWADDDFFDRLLRLKFGSAWKEVAV